jgi:hypothetical protein
MDHRQIVTLLLIAILLVSGCVSQTQVDDSSKEEKPGESVTEYATERGIPQNIIDSLQVLENDEEFDAHEKAFIDLLSRLPDTVQELIMTSVILNDETVDAEEVEFIKESLDMDDLTIVVLESSLATQPINEESVQALKNIKALSQTDESRARQILESQFPALEIQFLNITQNSAVIHKTAWQTVVDKAAGDSSYKYGIYVTRTLAVTHPEIYLQADGLFIEGITTHEGFKTAYEVRDVHDEYLYGRDVEGPPFSFEYVDFTAYTLIESKDVYPDGYPVLPFLDRRLLPIASTLKSATRQLTQLEKGIQVYFMKKEEGTEHLYIIYCDNENTYLFDRGTLIQVKDMSPVDTTDGDPILIFNEDSVWYPLMERDDSEKDQNLKEVVAAYTQVTTPYLEDFEKEMVEKLKQVTNLTSEFEKNMAIFSSLRPARNLDEYIHSDSYEALQESGVYFIVERRSLLKHGNYLSPITAYCAAVVKEYEGEKKMREVTNEYLTYTKMRWLKQAHGHVWFCDFVEQTVEESYTTKGGHCIVQTANISAALDLADVDNYWIQGYVDSTKVGGSPPFGHDWVYVPDYDLIISNGGIESYGTILCYHPTKKVPHDRIGFVGLRDGWAYVAGLVFLGTLQPAELIEMLEYLRGIHQDEMMILKDMTDYAGVPLEEFYELLEQQSLHEIRRGYSKR